MTPSARLAAAIDILEGLVSTAQPADRFIKEWFRSRRFAGSGDRREIGELVFHVLRHRARLSHRMGRDGARALVIASLLETGRDPAALFTGGYGPEPLSQAEQTIIATPPQGEAPLWVQGEFPPWLEGQLQKRFGGALLDEMAAFAERAPVDLRVNGLKASRDAVLARLRDDKFDCAAIGRLGIRCASGSALNKHPLFEEGAFEVQDLAAQIAAERAEAKAGMRVLDLAAGAGGKSLALAAAMENKGQIIACDVRGAALAELEKRAVRAGVGIIQTHILGLPPSPSEVGGPFDLIFVDAPCSGSGTWRRQPELKWRLTPQRLAGLEETQARMLRQGAGLCGPGGRLVYATCSILPSENEVQIAAFLAENPAFARWQPDFQASPAATASDGFYAAFLARI